MTDRQHSHGSGDGMPLPAGSVDVRAARCQVRDTASFLCDLRAIAAAHGTRIICFNADMIAGRRHAVTAVARAVRAFGEGAAISNTLEMEALLYAAGSRQCSLATTFGIHAGENRVYICCVPGREEVWAALGTLFTLTGEDWEALGPGKRERLMDAFAITEEEIAAAGGDGRIVDLVLERVALLQVSR